MMEETSPSSHNSNGMSSPYYITTDLDNDKARENVARQALAVMGELLDGASQGLAELEQNELLGSAIVRKCKELADIIGDLVNQMSNQTQEERRALAQACLHDARQAEQEFLRQPQQQQLLIDSGDHMQSASSPQSTTTSPPRRAMSSMSEDDMLDALSGAQSVLLDVESALRSIGQDEADEIADVAVTVARLFVASLQSAYSTLTPEQLAGTALEESDRVVILDDGQTTSRSAPRKQPSFHNKDRVRALWPPLGPAVASALQWGKDAAMHQPVLAVALGLTMWPAALVTACLSTPILVADGLLQHVYDNLQDGPLVQTLERGAAQVYHASRLTLLCSGLVCRQAIRVANRQLKRHGGPEQVAQNVAGFCIDRASHPVETVCQSAQGIGWGFNILKDAAITLKDIATNEMEKEMDKTCQTLQ